MKKNKLKESLKKKKAWLMTTGGFLLVGIIALIVGMVITGFDLIRWLQSPQAVTVYIFLTLGILGIVLITILHKRSHLGD